MSGVYLPEMSLYSQPSIPRGYFSALHCKCASDGSSSCALEDASPPRLDNDILIMSTLANASHPENNAQILSKDSLAEDVQGTSCARTPGHEVILARHSTDALALASDLCPLWVGTHDLCQGSCDTFRVR